ncbi:MAG: MFS transporter [Mycobacteriales bacterium]
MPAQPPPTRMTQGAAGTKWGRYGARPLVVLCLVGLVDAIDRGVLPGVLPAVQRELHFDDQTAGYLNSALIVATLLLAVPGGLLADRRDRRVLMGGVLGLWSLATGLAAAAQTFWQLFVVRSALGAGDAINDPSCQSLVADYYPVEVRGRAYAWQRVVPTVGLGAGVGIGAALGAAFGWRVAVLSVGAPGLLVALLVRRLPLPPRGDADLPLPVLPATAPVPGLPVRDGVRAVLAVRSLRVLLVSTAFINGILTALAFWGVSYHVRASGLSEGSAGGIAGGVILVGAVAGGVGGGIVTDRIRDRYRGAPMLLAGAVTGSGALLLLLSFVDGIPVFAVRLPLQMVGVALVVSALPPLTVVTAEVVPPELRGTSFGLLKLCANVLAAATPPLIGALADTHRIRIHTGEVVGDLGFAFRCVTPLVLVGSVLLLAGRRHLQRDLDAALGLTTAAAPGLLSR